MKWQFGPLGSDAEVTNTEEARAGLAVRGLRLVRRHRPLAAVILLSVFVAACATVKTVTTHPGHDRGVNIPHEPHTQDTACTDCHEIKAEGPAYPNHGTCETCHEIDVDKPDPKKCGMCHTNADYEIKPRPKTLSEEIKFDHAPHVAKEVPCKSCHIDPDKQFLPSGQLMPFCVDCHTKQGGKLTECQTCHKEISKNTRPTTRHGARIAHDSPDIWQQIHGREFQKDKAYCGMCHTDEQFCSDCHRVTKPKSHTAVWRDDTHGQRATWDRRQCAVCHEEDMCQRCHENTEPSSHRGSWEGRNGRHCQACHFPPTRAQNCTVCHEDIDHEKAPVSPHKLGQYPTPCSSCHPGTPGRPPHFDNSSVRCISCH